MNELSPRDRVPRIGIVGSGFMGRGLFAALSVRQDAVVTRVLTRRPLSHVRDIPQSVLTDSRDSLVEMSDVIVECSGDPLYATETIAGISASGIPVVTMNAEFHVTAGSYFVGKGVLTEAAGDQPGCEAALLEEVIAMGFRPRVIGNVKRFLNHKPTLADMDHWSRLQGNRLEQTVAFTDGTKVQIEQALVANGLGAQIVCDGMRGPAAATLEEGALLLAEEADRLDTCISDYVLCRTAAPGVFIVATHDDYQQPYLKYYGLGDGPHYVIVRPMHLCHLEVWKTIKRVLLKTRPLLDNSTAPRYTVSAVAKRELMPGTRISRGIGSFDVRGVAVELKPHVDDVPIGLMQDVIVRRRITADAVVQWDDVEMPESLALTIWKGITAGQ